MIWFVRTSTYDHENESNISTYTSLTCGVSTNKSIRKATWDSRSSPQTRSVFAECANTSNQFWLGRRISQCFIQIRCVHLSSIHHPFSHSIFIIFCLSFSQYLFLHSSVSLATMWYHSLPADTTSKYFFHTPKTLVVL